MSNGVDGVIVGINHYGYKDHVKADKKTSLIEKYDTTDASMHDSKVIRPLIEEKDKWQGLFLYAGYESKEDVVIACGMNPIICEKGHRNHPLTDEQKRNNLTKSKIRCRGEHIFGFARGSHAWVSRAKHRDDARQSRQCADKPCLYHLQVCANQHLPAAAHPMQGITAP